MKFVIEHLSKSFEKKEVLRDIDFTFDEGKIYGLLGRNGAGKTTLFNCLNRDLKADSGNFYIEDENGVRREVSAEDIGMYSSTPSRAGVSYRQGVFEILYGHQREVYQKSEKH